MPSDLRAYFEQRATELANCAELVVTDLADGETLLTIVPHHPFALGVYLVDSGESHQVAFDHRFYLPDEDARAAVDVDGYLDAAVEGRVRMLIGPSRARILLREGDRVRTLGHHSHGLRSLIPSPGWRRRAQVVDFAPYRRPSGVSGRPGRARGSSR